MSNDDQHIFKIGFIKTVEREWYKSTKFSFKREKSYVLIQYEKLLHMIHSHMNTTTWIYKNKMNFIEKQLLNATIHNKYISSLKLNV